MQYGYESPLAWALAMLTELAAELGIPIGKILYHLMHG